MEIVVADANIFIDLQHIDLLPSFFSLGFQVRTSVLVLQELDVDLYKKLEKYNLEIISIDNELSAKKEILNFSSSFSYTDTISLSIAYKEQAVLLTGEELMKKWCRDYNIEVLEIMDVLNEIVIARIVSSDEIISCLQKLQQYNFWLPSVKCVEYIENWKLM